MSVGRYSTSDHSNGGYNRSHSREKKSSKEFDPECTTLYVSNIDPRCSPEVLKEIFGKYGQIDSCRIIHNPITRESRGFGFVSFTNVADANEALQALNGKELERRQLRVEKAKRNEPHKPTPGYYRGPPVRSRNHLFSGASVKYDTRGKLKPGFYPYYEVNARNGYSPDDDKAYSRRRSPRSHDYSPRYPHSDRAYDDYYRGYPSYDGYGDRYRESYRHRSRSREPERYERHRGRSRERHREGYVDADNSRSRHRM